MKLRTATNTISVASLAVLAACLFSQTPPWPQRATIRPSVVHIAPGATQRFRVVIGATRLRAATAPDKVIWTVNDIPGGNTEVGTIDAAGLYRAPEKEPTPHEIRIRSEVPDAVNHFVWATVLIGRSNPAYKLVREWSEPAAPPGHLRKPHGISIDMQGNLLIADQSASRVFRYSKAGRFLGEIGKGPGSENGEFSDPRYATVDREGNIYVTDVKSDRARIQIFDPQGHFLRIFGEKGTGASEILRGHGLAFDTRQRLFVDDVDNTRISIFDRAGKFLSSWGKEGPYPGQFNAPHGLYIDPNDDVFVTCYYGPTQKFTASGDFLTTFASGDPPDGPVYFHSVSGDRWGNVYVTVRNKGRSRGQREGPPPEKLSMVKYNNNGDCVTSISFPESNHIESWSAIDKDGTVYAIFTTKGSSGVEIFEEQ